MQITLQADYSGMIPEGLWDEIKLTGQAAMANRFASIVHNNFGAVGEDRPEQWPNLSYHYAQQVHDGDRTPKLQLSGALQESIQIDESSLDAASVFTNNEYALEHQNGNPEKNLPARPFFPIVGDSLTGYSERECLEAGQNAINRLLN